MELRKKSSDHSAVLKELEVEDMLQSHESEEFVDDDSDSEPAKENNLMGMIFGEGFDSGGSMKMTQNNFTQTHSSHWHLSMRSPTYPLPGIDQLHDLIPIPQGMLSGPMSPRARLEDRKLQRIDL